MMLGTDDAWYCSYLLNREFDQICFVLICFAFSFSGSPAFLADIFTAGDTIVQVDGVALNYEGLIKRAIQGSDVVGSLVRVTARKVDGSVKSCDLTR